MKKICAILLAFVIVFTSSMAFALDGDATDVIADTFILRPLGFAATVAGGAVFVISLPMALITKSTDKTYKVLVKEPFEYTFVRPLGEIGSGL